MMIRSTDRPIVKWAIDQGFAYEYAREYGLPQPSLRVRMGFSTAYFEDGQLIRWYADVEGAKLDQLMFELTSLFLGCTQSGALPKTSLDEADLGAAELRTRTRGN